MKKNILRILLVTSGFINFLNAQSGNVGIGTRNPDASAALDISNDNLPVNGKKGVLLPRVSLLNNTDVATIQSPANGLVVYNLADNGTGNATVTKDTFYFWNGAKWIDLALVDTVKKELLPQVFFLIGNSRQITTGITPDITAGVVVDYQTAATVLMNAGNHITKNTNNTFTINSTGRYELSGSINYNPSMSLNASSNVEFIAQISTDNMTWTDLAKTTGVWGNGTGGNSRTLIITPTVLSLPSGNFIRFMLLSTYGAQGTVVSSGVLQSAAISTPTGLGFSRSLKIQYLN